MKEMNEVLGNIIDELYCLKDDELMGLAQKHLNDNLWEEKVGYMSDLDEACQDLTASEILENIDENFCLSDSFIYIDNIGVIYSYDDLSIMVDDKIGFDLIAKDIIEAGCCDIASIQEILDEMEEE